jgi:4-amino-4-deoxy-L-arabinose transferase-like glycosyltransferase
MTDPVEAFRLFRRSAHVSAAGMVLSISVIALAIMDGDMDVAFTLLLAAFALGLYARRLSDRARKMFDEMQ